MRGKGDCPSGKVVFLQPGKASQQARELSARHNAEAPNKVYRCPQCGYFHTTHLKDRVQRRREEQAEPTVLQALAMLDEYRNDG